jgi:transposase
MVVVGFDVGKDSLFAARIDRSSKVKEHYQLANEAKQITALLKKLQAKHKHLLVASEATGDYHRTLALACLSLNIPFKLLNPITTKQYVRATVRKRKTDKTDAEVIARVAMQDEGFLVTPETFADAKPVLRTSTKLVHISRTVLLMQKRLEFVMPQEKELSEQLTQCQEQLNKAVAIYRKRAQELLANDELKDLLQTIPGVGPVTALTLMTEIGDITRFKSPKALVAYAGLDPRVRQSGYTLTRNTRLTKRGSPYLRLGIFTAATIAKRWNPSLHETYERKRAEGKRYKEAIVVVSRRLLNCVYAVWTTGKAYQQLK